MGKPAGPASGFSRVSYASQSLYLFYLFSLGAPHKVHARCVYPLIVLALHSRLSLPEAGLSAAARTRRGSSRITSLDNVLAMFLGASGLHYGSFYTPCPAVTWSHRH